jgi:NtrC-family two-component system sensor histidine kinase KinB
VPAEFRARIFDKFFRLQHSQGDSRSGGRGAGLGLYLCRQVVERHGGRIRCDAGPHGVGARMTVTLPAQ